MRCPECNKFVPYDDGSEPEVQSVDIETTGEVNAEVRFPLLCAECGTELKEGIYSLSEAPDLSEHITAPVEGDEEPVEHLLEVEGDGCTVETVVRKGVTNYVITLTAKVTCTGCDFETEVDLAGEMTAAEMEELV